MKNTRVKVSNQAVNTFPVDLLVFWAMTDANDQLLVDPLAVQLLQVQDAAGDFRGKTGEWLQLYPQFLKENNQFAAKRILLVGLGTAKDAADASGAREMLRVLGGGISGHCVRLKARSLGVHVFSCPHLTEEAAVESLTEGILLGDYRFTHYKKSADDAFAGISQVTIITTTSSRRLTAAIRRAEHSALATCTARDMANEPGNGWTAEHFARYAERIGQQYGLQCMVFGQKELKKMGMGGLLAVNQGSATQPRLVVLVYEPPQATGTILLVGKGLTFDSGGICVKPAENMQDMKYDMCGGAAVLTVMPAIAAEKLSQRVVAIVPATDNMISGSAVKPGDIIRHYGGASTEIINTDAEGRLILADALAYGIEKWQPDCVIDLATLTGAVIIALGHHHAGVFGTNDGLLHALQAAGKKAGEPLWHLPLGPDYSKQIESKVADMKNTGGRPAGSCTAAAYLQQFVGNTPWAHIDIAGTAWDFTEKSYIPKGPSGFGVRLLLEFLRNWKTDLLTPKA